LEFASGDVEDCLVADRVGLWPGRTETDALRLAADERRSLDVGQNDITARTLADDDGDQVRISATASVKPEVASP
jgi:hypothetical protein